MSKRNWYVRSTLVTFAALAISLAAGCEKKKTDGGGPTPTPTPGSAAPGSAAAGSTAPAPSAGGTPGVTATEIKIGQTMPYSGPASAYGVIGKTEAAFFKMINE